MTTEQIAKISSQSNWKNAYTSLLRAAAPTAIREPATETSLPSKTTNLNSNREAPRAQTKNNRKAKNKLGKTYGQKRDTIENLAK